MKHHILLLEDDTMIASGITYALEKEGYDVVCCEYVRDAKNVIKSQAFDLAILDMQLPDGSGFDVSVQLRERGTSVIFLTVEDDEAKIVRAFEEGVDDYIVKPFRIRELLARVNRTLHKYENAKPEIMTIGAACIDVQAAKVFVGEEPVELTALEYRLLLIFARNRSKVLSRTQILQNIWDMDGNYVEDNTLTVYIKRLREKMGTAVTIETVRGIGYRVD
ncbi:MAG: response regulator transcription factor [Eubacterium sp.]|nr:response regulator transcription factor [Eubacterium sp.]